MPNASINHGTFIPLLPSVDITGQRQTQTQTQTQAPFHEFDLRQTVQSQAEQITELRIRIAVLETELRHVTRERDGVLGREGLVAGVLGRVLAASSSSSNVLWSTTGDTASGSEGDKRIDIGRGDISAAGAVGRQVREVIEELKWELGKARRENLVLWGRIEGRRGDGSGEEVGRGREVERGNSFDSVIGGEFGPSTDDNLPPPQQNNTTAPAAAAKKDGCSIAPSYDSRPLRLSGFSGFDDNGLNIGISNEEDPDLGLGFNIATTIESKAQKPGQDFGDRETVNESGDSERSGVEDVGLTSLDDVLGGPEDDLTVPNGRDSDRGVTCHDTGIKRIDGDTKTKQDCFGGFLKFPAPGVLKTGFDVSRSFRGDEYIHDPPTIQQQQHHSARDHVHSCRPVDFPRYPSRFPPFFDHHHQHHPRWRDGNNEAPFNQSSSSYFDRTRDSVFDPTENNSEFRKYSSNSRDFRLPEFFRYGIRYHPSDTDTNFLRTVHISNLPADISTKALLDHVRGGDIVSAILLNTISITGSMTALVQFANDASAAAYVEYIKQKPISFSFSSSPFSPSSSDPDPDHDDKVATITLLSTPTYPVLPTPIITDSEGVEIKRTRCLCISSFPSHISLSELKRDLACNNEHRAASLINIIDRRSGIEADREAGPELEHEDCEEDSGDDNTQPQPQSQSALHLEFSSVAAAAAAYGFLSTSMVYGEVCVGFEGDPCAGEVRELAEI